MYDQEARAAAEEFRDLLTRLGAQPSQIDRARRNLRDAEKHYAHHAARKETEAAAWRRDGAPNASIEAEARDYRRWQAIAQAKLAVLDTFATD